MKKYLNSFCAVFVLAASLLVTGCKAPSGGGGGSKNVIVNTAVTGSEVFIDGRSVEIYAKWICDHEVTQKEFKDIMGSDAKYDSYSEYGYGEGNNYPVYYVSWYDAITYCNKRSISEHLTPCYEIAGMSEDDWKNLTYTGIPTSNNAVWNLVECDFTANGYRLPTEAEWEYFARGGAALSEDKYSGTNDDAGLENYAWYGNNSNTSTHEVGKKFPNSLGLYDMSGNVWEWCWDWYDAITVDTPSTGPTSASQRKIRGGGFFDSKDKCTTGYRNLGWDSGTFYQPGKKADLGFRVCRSAQ